MTTWESFCAKGRKKGTTLDEFAISELNRLESEKAELLLALKKMLHPKCTGELNDGGLYFRDNDISRDAIKRAQTLISKIEGQSK